MITETERKALIAQRMDEERDSPEHCLWMSFCDPERPKGQQFLGVVILRTKGVAHAIAKTWQLGINPGGEVMSYTTDPGDIKPEHFDRLLSHAELVEFGYCD